MLIPCMTQHGPAFIEDFAKTNSTTFIFYCHEKCRPTLKIGGKEFWFVCDLKLYDIQFPGKSSNWWQN